LNSESKGRVPGRVLKRDLKIGGNRGKIKGGAFTLHVQVLNQIRVVPRPSLPKGGKKGSAEGKWEIGGNFRKGEKKSKYRKIEVQMAYCRTPLGGG